MNLFKELQRRKVFWAAALYAAGAWLTTEIVRFILEQLEAPNWTDTALALVLAIEMSNINEVVAFPAWDDVTD